jgi:hypothetical protein
VSTTHNHPTSAHRAGDPTTGVRTEFSEPTAIDAASLSDIDGLPPGTAVLVVKRGPNIGLRFLLQQPITTAGRIPAATSTSTTSRSAA